MPLPRDKAWFPAKSYGWGWGLPSRWQGWLVLLAFAVAVPAGSPLMKEGKGAYAAYCGALVIALIAICYWKGEAPRWRWGNDS